MNRKAAAGDQTISFAWIFMLFFIAIMLVGGVVLFFGSDIDIRGIESAQMSNKVKDCIISGKIDMKNKLELEEIEKKCGIDEKVLTDYFLLSISKEEEQLIKIKDATSCDFKGTEDNPYYPRCRDDSFIFNGESYSIKVGSHQFSRRGLG
ncbi:hypothetical protein FJZ18_02745 [Candidatus Pacearchaeota archaeon]|nr:hypothetical protein [Candidatus Pacearchaeota archaeon]